MDKEILSPESKEGTGFPFWVFGQAQVLDHPFSPYSNLAGQNISF